MNRAENRITRHQQGPISEPQRKSKTRNPQQIQMIRWVDTRNGAARPWLIAQSVT